MARKFSLILYCCLLHFNFAVAEQKEEKPSVTIDRNTIILIDRNEDQPIKRALQDLQRDLSKVFGVAPKIAYSFTEIPKNANLIVVACKGTLTTSVRNPKLIAFESHAITTAMMANHKAVILQGADMRGTIFAIYSFSEKFLQIPPLWIWTSYEPQKKTQLIVAAKTALYFPSPTVKWRAWFPNDKDLLAPWQSKNAENFDAIYETMLRLKINTREGYLIDADGWKTPYKASKDACYARDRGFKISFTHTAPFGATLTNWERYWNNIRHQKMPLSIKNVQGLKEFWKYHIETIKREKLDVIWQIGFRGLGDKPFWRKTFIDAMDEPKTDSERAAIINKMLEIQIGLLKETIAEQHPLMKITIYNEGSEFLAAGLLKLPGEPNLILNYAGTRADHYPPAEMQNFDQKLAGRPIGYYLNFQFTGTGSHLVAGEGPWKMEQNFRYLEQKTKKPLTFSVVNTGNVREHVLELSANATMLWNYDSYRTDEFLKTYCETYYGKNSAGEISNLYKDYYNAYWVQRKADLPDFDRQYIFQDLRYARGLTQISTLWNRKYLANPFNDQNKGVGGAMAIEGRQYNIVPSGDAKNQIDAAILGMQKSGAQFEIVANKANLIYEQLPLSVQPFFNDELRAPAIFMQQANVALGNLVQGYQNKQDGKAAAAKMNVEETIKALTLMKVIKASGNYGRFKDWSLPEKNFGIDSIKNDVEDLLKKR